MKNNQKMISKIRVDGVLVSGGGAVTSAVSLIKADAHAHLLQFYKNEAER